MAQKINSDVMKQSNRKEVLRLIRKKPCSRISLAKKMGLTRATISFICEQLLDEGLLIEGEKEASIGGRPATLLHLNPAFGVFGGVHFSRNEYAVGVCNFAGEVILEKRGKVSSQNAILTLNAISSDLSQLLKDQGRLLGIGVAGPGPLDKKAGCLGNVPNFDKWKNFKIVEFFKQRFGCLCILDNYSNALAYAEYSQNKSCEKKYLELIIDSGFGSSVAIVNSGVTLLECELGHTSINLYGEKCDCGNVGCAELYVNENKFFGNDEEVEMFYVALSSVIVNAVNSFAVKQVVFAGCVAENFDKFSKSLQIQLEKRNVKDIKLTCTSLKQKELFVACNLIINETTKKTIEV